MNHPWKYILCIWSVVGCAQVSPAPDPSLALGSAEEKNAVAEVKRLAVQHGYHPEKMNLEVNADRETGNFSIFLFPKPVDSQHLKRELGLFAIVNAKSGRVIRFSDPATDFKSYPSQ